MAKTSEGILGAVTGTIGPVTGYVRNGQNILRTSKSSVTYKSSPLRKIQLDKITICNSFTGAFSGTGFFNKSFPAYGSTGTGYNRATSALMSQAIISVNDVLQLTYPQVLISKGMLPKAENAVAALFPNGNIQFTFTDNSNTGTASADDTIILVAYCEALQQAVFTLNAGYRKDATAILHGAIFTGYAVDTWIGFLSIDERNAGDSVWAGRIEL